MKKLFVAVLVIAIALMGASVAMAAISTTLHNMSSNSTNAIKGDIGEICVYCHTPHGGAQAAGQPLWNRSNPAASAFTPYSCTSTTTVGTLNAGSLVCLSCHDGTTAVNSLLNYQGATHTGGGAGTLVTGIYAIANDGASLTNDHPVGVPIPNNANFNATQPLLSQYLVSGQVECSTCHAVHGAGFASFLRASNADSALCLDCHNK